MLNSISIPNSRSRSRHRGRSYGAGSEPAEYVRILLPRRLFSTPVAAETNSTDMHMAIVPPSYFEISVGEILIHGAPDLTLLKKCVARQLTDICRWESGEERRRKLWLAPGDMEIPQRRTRYPDEFFESFLKYRAHRYIGHWIFDLRVAEALDQSGPTTTRPTGSIMTISDDAALEAALQFVWTDGPSGLASKTHQTSRRTRVSPRSSSSALELTCDFSRQVAEVVTDPHQLRSILMRYDFDLQSCIRFTQPGEDMRFDVRFFDRRYQLDEHEETEVQFTNASRPAPSSSNFGPTARTSSASAAGARNNHSTPENWAPVGRYAIFLDAPFCDVNERESAQQRLREILAVEWSSCSSAPAGVKNVVENLYLTGGLQQIEPETLRAIGQSSVRFLTLSYVNYGHISTLLAALRISDIEHLTLDWPKFFEHDAQSPRPSRQLRNNHDNGGSPNTNPRGASRIPQFLDDAYPHVGDGKSSSSTAGYIAADHPFWHDLNRVGNAIRAGETRLQTLNLAPIRSSQARELLSCLHKDDLDGSFYLPYHVRVSSASSTAVVLLGGGASSQEGDTRGRSRSRLSRLLEGERSEEDEHEDGPAATTFGASSSRARQEAHMGGPSTSSRPVWETSHQQGEVGHRGNSRNFRAGRTGSLSRRRCIVNFLDEEPDDAIIVEEHDESVWKDLECAAALGGDDDDERPSSSSPPSAEAHSADDGAEGDDGALASISSEGDGSDDDDESLDNLFWSSETDHNSHATATRRMTRTKNATTSQQKHTTGGASSSRAAAAPDVVRHHHKMKMMQKKRKQVLNKMANRGGARQHREAAMMKMRQAAVMKMKMAARGRQ